MNEDAREFWNWIWKTDAGKLTRICTKEDRKLGLPKHINSNPGDMDL